MSYLLLFALLLMQPIAHYRHDGHADLPDSTVTPGDVDRSLTTDVLCDPSHHTAENRHVSQSLKVKVCLEYGITKDCPSHDYEIDHLISLEIGGSDGITNLWPQPVDADGVIGFHTKDKVENAAHRAVCSGEITLREAQQGISGDWYGWARKQGLLPAN